MLLIVSSRLTLLAANSCGKNNAVLLLLPKLVGPAGQGGHLVGNSYARGSWAWRLGLAPEAHTDAAHRLRALNHVPDGMPTGCCCARRPYVQGATNSGQPASPSPATSLSAIWPAYQVNGTGTHFWLKEDELTPLLSTGDITLSGKTFNRPDTGHQWFDQFVLSNHGKAVLDVGIVNGETQIKLNGKVVSSGKVRSLPQQFPQSSSKLSSSVCTGVRFHCLHHPADCWRLAAQRGRGGRRDRQ